MATVCNAAGDATRITAAASGGVVVAAIESATVSAASLAMICQLAQSSVKHHLFKTVRVRRWALQSYQDPVRVLTTKEGSPLTNNCSFSSGEVPGLDPGPPTARPRTAQGTLLPAGIRIPMSREAPQARNYKSSNL